MVAIRLLLLVLASVPVFIGFALPFILPGLPGYLLAGALILLGAALLWLFETRSAGWLETSGWFNDLLNTGDGDSD